MTNPKFTKRDKLDVARDICVIIVLHIFAFLFATGLKIIDYGKVDTIVIRVIAIQVVLAGLLVLAIWVLTKLMNKGDNHE